MSPAADYDARKNLDAFFVPFNNFRMHLNRIANREYKRLFAILF
jgi:hypothetical protein